MTDAIQVFQDNTDLLATQDDREVFLTPRAINTLDEFQWRFKHFTVQIKNGAECLVLGGC